MQKQGTQLTIQVFNGLFRGFHLKPGLWSPVARKKSVTQNIRGVTERLLRAAPKMLGSSMRPSNSVWEPFFNK